MWPYQSAATAHVFACVLSQSSKVRTFWKPERHFKKVVYHGHVPHSCHIVLSPHFPRACIANHMHREPHKSTCIFRHHKEEQKRVHGDLKHNKIPLERFIFVMCELKSHFQVYNKKLMQRFPPFLVYQLSFGNSTLILGQFVFTIWLAAQKKFLLFMSSRKHLILCMYPNTHKDTMHTCTGIFQLRTQSLSFLVVATHPYV